MAVFLPDSMQAASHNSLILYENKGENDAGKDDLNKFKKLLKNVEKMKKNRSQRIAKIN